MSSTMKSDTQSSSKGTRHSESSPTSTYEERKAEYARIIESAEKAIKRLED
jgi:hypothetical protein